MSEEKKIIDIKDIRDNTAEMAKNKKEDPSQPQPGPPAQRKITDLNDDELQGELVGVVAVKEAILELININPNILTKKIPPENKVFADKYVAFAETEARLRLEKKRREKNES